MQELFGLGIANLVGSLFSAYPCTGSFSRSAVSNDVSSLPIIFSVCLCAATLEESAVSNHDKAEPSETFHRYSDIRDFGIARLEE